MDDFGIKYNSKKDAQHLLNAIGSKYKWIYDWTDSNYCGATLELNNEKDMSIYWYLDI